MATYLADRVIVFEGSPSVNTTAHTPEALLNGMNRFLQLLGITFRRDPNNFRPRINKDRSVKVSLNSFILLEISFIMIFLFRMLNKNVLASISSLKINQRKSQQHKNDSITSQNPLEEKSIFVHGNYISVLSFYNFASSLHILQKVKGKRKTIQLFF